MQLANSQVVGNGDHTSHDGTDIIKYGAKYEAFETKNGGVRHSGSLHPKPLGCLATPGVEMLSNVTVVNA